MTDTTKNSPLSQEEHSVFEAALAQPSPVRQVVMKELCPACEHQFVSHHNGYINRLRADQQPSPAPEAVEDRETPEIVGWMDNTGRPVKIGPSGRYHQPLMTISQHDRMALERWQYFRRKMQQMRDLMRGMRDRLTAAQARVAELEKQEPVAFRLLNQFGEVMTEWHDGTPPEKFADLCGNPVTDVRVQVAYDRSVAQVGQVPQHKFDGLVEEVRLKDAVIARQFERIRGLMSFHYPERGDGVWSWQGDGEDHLESLSCPVIISANDLRGLLAQAGQVPEGLAAKINECLTLAFDEIALYVSPEKCRDPRSRARRASALATEIRAALAAAPAQGGSDNDSRHD